jgi:hypothetical protein
MVAVVEPTTMHSLIMNSPPIIRSWKHGVTAYPARYFMNNPGQRNAPTNISRTNSGEVAGAAIRLGQLRRSDGD